MATIVQLVEQKYGEDHVLESELKPSQADNEALKSLVERYLRTVRLYKPAPRAACFFEQQPTNVAKFVDGEVCVCS
jgi:hypothetical protein